MHVHLLMTELDGNVIHVGTKAECEMILNAMVTYGIRKDKFVISDKHELEANKVSELDQFKEWMKKNGIVFASETNDAESTQDLHECYFDVIGQFNLEQLYKEDT